MIKRYRTTALIISKDARKENCSEKIGTKECIPESLADRNSKGAGLATYHELRCTGLTFRAVSINPKSIESVIAKSFDCAHSVKSAWTVMYAQRVFMRTSVRQETGEVASGSH